MKTALALLLLALFGSPLFAQTVPDSLRRSRLGFAVWTDQGLNNNRSLENLAGQLAPLGITLNGKRLASLGFSAYQRRRRLDTERRFWGFSTGRNDQDIRTARVEGLGAGLLFTRRLVDSRRWMLGPGLGYDFSYYRLRIDAAAPATVPIQTVLANPSAFQSVKLHGGALTLNLAVTGGVKFKLFPKLYDGWQLNARLGYHLPLAHTRHWTSDRLSVSGVDAYKPSNFYLNFGLVSFFKYRRWRERQD